MYVFLDNRKIRTHEQYIEQEEAEISRLLEWAEDKRKLSEDTYEYRTLSGIIRDLEKLKQSMRNRVNLMEEIIREFQNVGNVTERNLEMIEEALRDLEIDML